MASFSSFDTRNYRTIAPREGYDRWAATYGETVEDAMDVALLERLEVDWGAGARVADLGCGPHRATSPRTCWSRPPTRCASPCTRKGFRRGC